MPPDTNYGLRDHVREELDRAHALFREHPQWPVVDVTGRAIEETAGIIVETLRQRGRVLF
jgi:regulator of PEP synthase PpsR (kinase-PPPase family)